MTKHLYYVQVRKVDTDPSPFGGTSLPVLASCFTEAIERVQKAYPNAHIIGVTVAEPTEGMQPLL